MKIKLELPRWNNNWNIKVVICMQECDFTNSDLVTFTYHIYRRYDIC